MALQPYQRMVPMVRSPQSYFWPDMQVGQWQDFGAHMQHMRNQMQKQMQDMERQMQETFSRFNRLMPMDPKPFPPIDMNSHNWASMANPIITTPDGQRHLKLQFDVRQFRPEEIHVRTQDNLLMVHAKHKVDTPNTKMYREYNRQFLLPQGVTPETMRSTLSPEGVLTVEAPIPAAIQAAPQRALPVEYNRT